MIKLNNYLSAIFREMGNYGSKVYFVLANYILIIMMTS